MYTLVSGQQTDGTLTHTGRLRVSCKLNTGAVVTVTLPDDWQTLLARVTALEAVLVPNSLEDLTYGG
jgi:hypothetical protein